MIDKYNAFISYRHSLQDNKIAKEVQTQLEHFRIPHKIRKATGKKRIDRIFRDKEELPITSDLNEDIDFALAHSDYLIVLCSTHTSESIWVQKEIETFLRNHTKKEILTVLVDGEPEDVIPEVLTHDTVTRTLSDGSVVTYEDVIEPLSCDYRLPIKTARKEELPRIAASIIGCSYDELMRRRRQYRIRRALIATAIAAVVSIGVMGYLTWSLTQIKTNYDKALTNQSENYAVQSELALEANDKVEAIEMALKGLPSEDNPDMPVTDEAWKALSDALGVYWAPGLKTCDPSWKYEMESTITDFVVSDDQQYLAAVDSSNNIKIWEAVTHKTVMDLCYPGEAIEGLGFAGEDKFVVISTNKITGYSISDWEEEWSTDVDCRFGHLNNCISSTAECDLFTAYIDDGVAIVDSTDGRIVKIIKFQDVGCDYFSDVKMRKDGSLVAVTCSDPDTISLSSYIVIYDMEKDTYTRLDGDFYLVTASRFTPDGDFAVMSVEDQDVYSSRFGDTLVLADSTVYIQKFDHETGKMLWSAQDNYTATSINKRLIMWNYEESDGSLTEVLVALYSDRCTVINNETGEVIRSIELPAEFVSVYSSGDTVLLLLLYNGQYCRVELSYDCETITSSVYFDDKIYQSDLINATSGAFGFVTRRNGDNYLIEYDTGCYDESFVAFDEMADGYGVLDYCVAGEYFIVYDWDDNVSAYDVESGDLEWSEKVGSSSSYEVEIIGASPDGETVYMLDDSIPYESTKDTGAKILAVDVESGDIEVIETLKGKHVVTATMNDNSICVAEFTNLDKNGDIFLYNIEDDDLTYYQADYEINATSAEKMYLSPDSRYMLACFTSNSFSTVLLYDFQEDEYEYIAENANGILCYAWKEDSSAYACGITGLIFIRSTDGDDILTIDTNGKNPVAMQYYNNELLVVYSVGILARYDEEGNLLSESDLDCYAIEATDPITFTFGEEEFVVTIDTFSTVFSIETFKPRAFIYNLDAYVPELDIFICHGSLDGERVYGYFENYDIEELINMGYEYITVEQDED
jgi:WD40 repeat protein